MVLEQQTVHYTYFANGFRLGYKVFNHIIETDEDVDSGRSDATNCAGAGATLGDVSHQSIEHSIEKTFIVAEGFKKGKINSAQKKVSTPVGDSAYNSRTESTSRRGRSQVNGLLFHLNSQTNDVPCLVSWPAEVQV